MAENKNFGTVSQLKIGPNDIRHRDKDQLANNYRIVQKNITEPNKLQSKSKLDDRFMSPLFNDTKTNPWSTQESDLKILRKSQNLMNQVKKNPGQPYLKQLQN